MPTMSNAAMALLSARSMPMRCFSYARAVSAKAKPAHFSSTVLLMKSSTISICLNGAITRGRRRKVGAMNKIESASPVCYASEDELFACAAPGNFPVEQYRKDFPILAQEVHGHPLVYLDTAASAQKPRQVIEAMTRFMENDYANVHRGVHELSIRATDQHEAARERVRRFI